MKRSLALLLALFMLTAALVPVQSFAADDKGLESAIKRAKSLFNIDDSYTNFDYYSYTYNGKTLWNLIWNRESTGSIYVQIDELGTVISYDRYDYTDYNERKLPRLSREEAYEKALEFIKKVNPDVLDQVRVEEYTGLYWLHDPYYYFEFYRVHNDILFPDNRIGVSVNKQTGEVHNYKFDWTDNVKFPDSSKAISLGEAEKAYEKNLGLKLIYSFNGDSKNPKVYLAYVPVFDSGVCIDALTGERIDLYSAIRGGAGGKGDAVYDTAEEEISEKVSLSPEEIKAIQEVNRLISQSKAEVTARSIKQLGITEKHKLIRAGLSKSWAYPGGFVWDLYFEKTNVGDQNADYIYVTLDAKTGELEGFSRSCNSEKPGEFKLDRNGARAVAEEFLKSIIPGKFEYLKYEEGPVYGIYPVAEEEYPETTGQRHYYFNYTRLVDGVPFVDNTASVNVDTVTGMVESFYITWTEPEFPDKNTAISIEKAYESFFAKIGLKLQYRLKGGTWLPRPVDAEQTVLPEVVLVYMADQAKPNRIDAATGEVINYDGTLYKESEPVTYTDISGHFAENEIAILAGLGISLPGTEFRPNDGIIQKDFLNLLAKILNWPSLSEKETQEEVDRMYSYLIRNGVVKAGEKNPSAGVTKEEGIRFIIRALGYEKVAELPDIFVVRFSDADQISKSMYGYVAIASALKLIEGDSENRFNPGQNLTRGEAAVIFYRMLLVE